MGEGSIFHDFLRTSFMDGPKDYEHNPHFRILDEEMHNYAMELR